jgi:hypothetical protein
MPNFIQKFTIRLKSLKYPAFSIAESITALLIISISFSAGTVIYKQVMDADKLFAKTNLSFILNQILAKTKSERNFIDETLTVEDVKIEKKIEPFGGEKDVYKVVVTAFDPISNEPLLKIEELISTHK